MSSCLTDYLAFMLGFLVAVYAERWRARLAQTLRRRRK